MFDLQKLVDTMNETASAERANYHMTLGSLVAALENVSPDLLVEYDSGSSPSGPESYRGYYCDLSFPPSSIQITVAELLREAKVAIGSTFEGYKGGDFTMHEKTPLWASPYGSANGVAIMGSTTTDGKLVLLTKRID
jgi:hypothetical protein